MTKYGIWHKPSSGWCSGYWFNPKSRLNNMSFVSNVNDAYKELDRWIRACGSYYEVREVEE